MIRTPQKTRRPIAAAATECRRCGLTDGPVALELFLLSQARKGRKSTQQHWTPPSDAHTHGRDKWNTCSPNEERSNQINDSDYTPGFFSNYYLVFTPLDLQMN